MTADHFTLLSQWLGNGSLIRIAPHSATEALLRAQKPGNPQSLFVTLVLNRISRLRVCVIYPIYCVYIRTPFINESLKHVSPCDLKKTLRPWAAVRVLCSEPSWAAGAVLRFQTIGK